MTDHPCTTPLDSIDMARCITCGDLVIADGKPVKPNHPCECCGQPICDQCTVTP